VASRLRVYLYLLIVLFPVATFFLGVLNKSNGLIWLVLETGFYYPTYVMAAPMFETLEMGLLAPTVEARCLAFFLYSLFLFLFFKIKDKLLQEN
jgi:hypothetical protein